MSLHAPSRLGRRSRAGSGRAWRGAGPTALLAVLLPAALPSARAADPHAVRSADLHAIRSADQGVVPSEPVDVALVLVSDVSRSIDDGEFRLEKEGYASAFSSPAVRAAIRSGPAGAVAVAYVEFAGEDQVSTVLGWSMLRDDGSIDAFVQRLEAAPRTAHGRTAIGAGIDAARGLIARSGLEAQRRLIDVAGDGTNNAGRPASEARDAALAAGITVNGLAIINDHPVNFAFAHTQPPGGLDSYYRANVAGGPGSFVLAVHDFHAFGEAMSRKLVSEIASLSPRDAAQPAERRG